MARHRRKLSVSKLVLPTAVILIVAVFVLAAALYAFNPPPAQSKDPAAEYFKIRGAVLSEYGYQEVNQTNGKFYIVKAMGFNITAVKGDAHGVVIYWGDAASDEVQVLKQGQSTWLQVLSNFGKPVGPVVGSTFTTDIRVASKEAEGEVTVTVS